MNIKKNEFEILSYIEREGGKKLPQRKIADDTMLSLGMVNKSLAELGEMGLIRQTDKKELQITKLGMEALEPCLLYTSLSSKKTALTWTPQLISPNNSGCPPAIFCAQKTANHTALFKKRGLSADRPLFFAAVWREGGHSSSSFSTWYLCRVARPPRICRSCLLISNTFLTSRQRAGLSFFNRSDTSLCTVDLLTPKALAACRTVVLFSTIKLPSEMARSSTFLSLIHI